MLPLARPARRAVMGAIGAGALAGGVLFGIAASATAQPPPPAPVPPPCTAAELSRVMSGVSFDTSNYLSTHPDVNNYFTSLMGQPKDQVRAQVQTYLRRQSASQGRPSAHQATRGRLPYPLSIAPPWPCSPPARGRAAYRVHLQRDADAHHLGSTA